MKKNKKTLRSRSLRQQTNKKEETEKTKMNGIGPDNNDYEGGGGGDEEKESGVIKQLLLAFLYIGKRRGLKSKAPWNEMSQRRPTS
ncbi:hypothetical protein Pcinc_030533 [Petrolisthes cinctipes]|uniref:Uncharacterized protein n=1 Tax=Petrolisthes cinctipes TaxID=88211 RepID=A0AAE1K2E5_PETCI|nr:hypothetical protein Pcinc_030533 [Petrolisthes cinctipes]